MWHDLRTRNYENLKRFIRARGRAPLSALFEFMKVVKAVKPALKNVHTKALIIHTNDDDVAYTRSAQYIFRQIQSVDKQIKIHPKGGHMVWKHECCKDVLKDIHAFLNATDLELIQ